MTFPDWISNKRFSVEHYPASVRWRVEFDRPLGELNLTIVSYGETFQDAISWAHTQMTDADRATLRVVP